jgi:hypothetical protein
MTLTQHGADMGYASPRRGRFARLRVRLLVLCAFAAVIAATVVIVSNTQRTAASAPTVTTLRSGVRRLPHFWTVRSGNTLSQISLRTGLSIATLEAYNPILRSSVLSPGEHLDLWVKRRRRR